MNRAGECCGNAECERCAPSDTNERAVLLTRLRIMADVDDLVTFALAGDGDIRLEAIRRLAQLARRTS